MSKPITQNLDLLQAARCEDLKYTEIKDLTVLNQFEKDIINKIKMPGAHLIQGARGVGKSQLLRIAEIELDETFHQDKKLSVYINFKTSPLLEGVNINDKNAFQVWVGAKILQAVHQKLCFLNILDEDNVDDPYQKIFNIDGSNVTQEFLKEKIHNIQNYALRNNTSSEEIDEQFINKVNDINYIRETLTTLVEKLKIDRIIFLFDEVAHTFIPAQQEIFFEIFKLIHGNSIAAKAAVYPTVTSYGKNFEVGQDAIIVSMDRFDTGKGLEEVRDLFREIFDKRVQSNNSLKKKVYSKGELLDQCIYTSSGNPRAFFHILLKAIDNGFNTYGVNNAIQDYVDSELIPYHNQVAKRLPKYSNHVVTGFQLCRTYLIDEIKKKNNRPKKSGYQSAFFTIDRDISPNLKIALDLLCYSGILTKKGTVKISSSRTGQRYMVHLAMMVTEKAFKNTKVLDAIKSLSLTDYREFSSNDKTIEQFSEDIKADGDLCSNCGTEVSLEAKFCSQCGHQIERTSLISKLLDDSIDKISVTSGTVKLVKETYPLVGDLLQATKKDLMYLYYIGQVRSRMLKNEVEEYISG